MPAPQRQSFVSEQDQLFLEDEHGRTLLVGVDFEVHDFLSGTCVAVRGKGDPDTGEFETYEIMPAGLAPQPTLPSKGGFHAYVSSHTFPAELKNKYVVLVSGVNLGTDGTNPIHFQLFVDFITGRSGSAMVSFSGQYIRLTS